MLLLLFPILKLVPFLKNVVIFIKRLSFELRQKGLAYHKVFTSFLLLKPDSSWEYIGGFGQL